MGSLDGKVALVTGSSSGIGEASAHALAAAGANVVVNSSASVEAGRAVASALATEGHYIQGDFSDETQCQALVQGTIERFGRLDILVNNAGWTTRVDLAEHAARTNEILFKTIEVNVYGTWWMCKAAMPHLKSTEGCIVNVTSIAGLRPMGSSCVRHGQSRTQRTHRGPRQVPRSGPVQRRRPGLVATPWTSEWGDLHTSIAAISPAGRSATPEDCAMAVMACVTNTYMSGTILKVDGGTTLAL